MFGREFLKNLTQYESWYLDWPPKKRTSDCKYRRTVVPKKQRLGAVFSLENHHKNAKKERLEHVHLYF